MGAADLGTVVDWAGQETRVFFCKIEGTLFISTDNVIDLDILSLSALSPMVEH